MVIHLSMDPRCAWLTAQSAKYHALCLNLVEKHLAEVCAQFDLKGSLCAGDYDFLSIVAGTADGNVSMAEIARRLEINPSSATRRARRLLACQLVSKSVDTSDERRYPLALTPLGRAFFTEMDNRLLAATQTMYATVTQDEMDKVFSFTEKCIENLQRMLDGELNISSQDA
jgi:DNA-binding MarR family transcriptional regulator